MRTRTLLLCLALLFPSVGLGGNETPSALTAVDFQPYAPLIGDSGPVVRLALTQQGYAITNKVESTIGSGQPSIANLGTFASSLANSYGVFYVGSHGSTTGLAVETYERSTAGYWAAVNACSTYVQYFGYRDQIYVGEPPDLGAYHISIRPTGISSRYNTNNSLVCISACLTNAWESQAWSSARARLSYNYSVLASLAYQEISSIFSKMNGSHGQASRILSQACSGLTITQSGDGATILAPSVLEVSPAPGTVISVDTPGYVVFDGVMDTYVDAGDVVKITNKALVYNAEWSADNRIDFIVAPYGRSESTLRVTADAVSQWGSVPIDGNTDPPGSDAQGPNRDPHEIALDMDATDINNACSFAGAGAFPAADGMHVWWVTDPELGSTSFSVYNGRSLVRTVSAEGGPDQSHFYEVVVPTTSESEYEVVENDSDPFTEYSTRPFSVAGLPDNLELLRVMNGSENSWTPFVWDPDEGGLRTEVPPVRVVFFSSRSDFLSGSQPVINHLQSRGVTTTTVLGSNSPYSAKAAAQAAYNAAIEEELPYLPLFCIVGEANEGDHPERNIVGTIYVPNEDGQCYWSSCASDPSIVDFDADKLPDMPWSRVPVNSTTELGYVVTTTLEVYNNQHVMSPRFLMLDGDVTYNGSCIQLAEPRATCFSIQSMYQAKNIPVVLLHDSDIANCSDYAARLARVKSYLNSSAGVTEFGGLGFTTHRSLLPGYYIQKLFTPVFSMTDVPKLQRIIGEFPGCGMGDTDRANPSYYPSIPKMFLAANPATSTTAAGWISHSRGGDETLHTNFAREYFEARLDGESWCVQDALFRAVRSFGRQLAARDYLLLTAAYGFPVAVPGMFNPSLVEEELNLPRTATVSISPNPKTPNAAASFKLSLPGYGRVDLALYDVQGRLVQRILEKEVMPPGVTSLSWDGRGVDGRAIAAGVYYVRLQINGRDRASSKVVVLR